MNNSYLVLDIETIASAKPEVREYIAANIKPPKTMSVAATIEKWHKESKAGAVDEERAKTSFDGTFGSVVCIGYALNDSGEPRSCHGLDEGILLCEFNDTLNALIPPSMFSAYTVVGHSVANFDLRFLLQRYIVNQVQPHPIINMAAQAKPWDSSRVYDTMTQFAGIGKTISLDRLCFALGIPSSKDEMDGSMVGQAVLDGRLDDVVRYCCKDVAATRAIYQRMTFV